MTTKVRITCPDNSHWDIKVTIEDQVFSFETQKMTDEWRSVNTITLKPTESHETYVHSSRRLTVEQVER